MAAKEKKHQLPEETQAEAEKEQWQINPLECLDGSVKCNHDHKKKQDAGNGNDKSGFDEWSVSWP